MERQMACQDDLLISQQLIATDQADTQQLWMRLIQGLTNRKELLVAYYTFVLGMSPLQISLALPDYFGGLSEVLSVKLHLLNHLAYAPSALGKVHCQ